MNTENNLFEGIAPHKPKHKLAIPKEFKPWHKPRKQWIRKNQWETQICELIEEGVIRDRPLRYFSLPGEDMIDIRVLAKMCELKSIKLKCLGFNNDPNIETNISWNEISKSITDNSLLHNGDFKNLKDKDDLGFHKFIENGPFDVINLDFCKSFFNRDYIYNHTALLNVLDFQISKTRHPWILLVTTRSDKELLKFDDLNKYWQLIKNNVVDYPEFGENLNHLINLKLPSHRTFSLDPSEIKSFNYTNFSKLFSVGFGKWLINLLRDRPDTWFVLTRDSSWYRIDNDEPNMLSLSFRFTPFNEPLIDPTGLGKSKKSSDETFQDEYSYLKLLVNKANSLNDVDRLIESDNLEYKKWIDESKGYMIAARYNGEEYVRWANDNRIFKT